MDEIKQNITHNITEHHLTFPSDYFQYARPYSCNYSFESIPEILYCCTERFLKDFAHSRSRDFFRASVLS